MIDLLIVSCGHQHKRDVIRLWGSPAFLSRADFFLGEKGDGVAIKDTVVYITNDGGKKWDGPISLEGYRYTIYPSSSLRNRYKIYDGAFYFYVVDNKESLKKRMTAEQPKRHLARFDLSTCELTVNSEGFSDVNDIFIRYDRLCARVDGSDIVECDEYLNIYKRGKLPFSCLSLVPTSNGYCTTHHGSVKFIEDDVVTTLDLSKQGFTGAIFSSSDGKIFIYCSYETESAIIKISDSGTIEETYEVFPYGYSVDFFSSGDAFFVLTLNDNKKFHLVYSLDGGETWSRRKIPFSIAATCHLAYYGGKLFY